DVLRQQLEKVVNGSDTVRQLPRSRHLSALGFRTLAAGVKRPAEATDPVRIGLRNEIALEGVDGTDADVVLLWGTAHLPGLVDGLLARGFEPAGVRWLQVGRLPRLWVSLLALVPVL